MAAMALAAGKGFAKEASCNELWARQDGCLNLDQGSEALAGNLEIALGSGN